MNKKNLIVLIRDFILSILSSLTNLLRVVFLSHKSDSGSNGSDNEEILIVSNGPSISSSENSILKKASDTTTMMVNFAPNTELYLKLKPNYLIIAAPELWLNDVDQRYKDRAKELFINISERTTWEMEFFMPFESRKFPKWQQVVAKNPLVRVTFFNNTPIEGSSRFSHFLFDKRLGMPRPHNITIPALMMSIWLNYKKISLVGVDHSWLPEINVDEENNVMIHQKHFYDVGQSTPRQMTKLGKGKRMLHEVLEKFVIAFKGYHAIEAYASTQQVKILNCTKGSFIDAFERQDLPD